MSRNRRGYWGEIVVHRGLIRGETKAPPKTSLLDRRKPFAWIAALLLLVFCAWATQEEGASSEPDAQDAVEESVEPEPPEEDGDAFDPDPPSDPDGF